MKHPLDEDERVWLKIPLSKKTADLLTNLADMCHADRASVAASLLHDVLKDDAATHFLETVEPAGSA